MDINNLSIVIKIEQYFRRMGETVYNQTYGQYMFLVPSASHIKIIKSPLINIPWPLCNDSKKS